jgi:hypothetical protein
MLTCKEVSRTIATEALVTTTWRRKLSIRLHLFLCNQCRRYADQLRGIGAAVRDGVGERALNIEARNRLRDSIVTAIPNSSLDQTDRDS